MRAKPIAQVAWTARMLVVSPVQPLGLVPEMLARLGLVHPAPVRRSAALLFARHSELRPSLPAGQPAELDSAA
jgi:hypothetical protein